MTMYDIIEKKKNKQSLTKEEIDFFINGYVNNKIPDYQVSSLLMAIVLNGMNEEEVTNLTIAMANSGDKINYNFNTVDKHSTGGVGDKTTLIIAPIVASLNCKVAKMSGKGLGFTGGTIDKLESIPDFKVQLTDEQFISQINNINLALISQTKNIAPADKKIYALRDVTATVDSIPLIASSIMSKKIASGASNLVLDVKVGSGAFMKNLESAKKLASTMVNIGKNSNINTLAILSNMNQPLGNNIGNILEVKEAIEVLNGNGPKDLKELSIELASYMVSLYKKITYEEAFKQVTEVLENKQALAKFYEFIKYQGGNIEKVKFTPKYEYKVYSKQEGYITKMNTEEIGKIASLLGAGRMTKDDVIDYEAGIVLNKKINDYVKVNDLLATLYTNKEIDLTNNYLEIIEITDEKIENDLILGVIK